MKRDLYQEVTEKIVGILEQGGTDDFQAPFAGLAAQGVPCNPVTKNKYQGVNIPSLWVDQQLCEFSSNQWATYKQWRELGAQVRKGEKGSAIVFYKTIVKTEEDKNGAEEEVQIPLLRFYMVFNANQVEGYDHHEVAPPNDSDLVRHIEHADQFCKNTGADIRHGGHSAYYHQLEDYIQIPETISFIETKNASPTENYYATLLHELTHWTGAPQRLDRDKAQSRKELDKYAFEELIAELGAAFLCSQLGITQTPREDHASYIKSWLKALKDDKKFIFRASAQAAKAADYLNNLQEGTA